MKTCKGCGLKHRENELSCQEAEVRFDRQQLAKLRRAVKWALGELGDFPVKNYGDASYWWRKHLRQRAGSAIKPRKSP